MKFNLIKSTSIFALAFAGMTGCQNKLDVTDQNNPTTASYFKTAAELQNGVNGIYSILRGGELVGREWFFTHDMRSAECAAGGPQLEQPRAELLNQASPSPSNSVMSNVWTGCYHMINRANLVIAKGPDVTDDAALRDRLVGEAKFLRAWAYFELVSMWGDVPVYTEVITSSTDFKGKTAAADIYSLVIADLTEAAGVLPESYSSADYGRATSGAANALLGRALMQKGDYGPAKDALLKVYGKYSLVSNYLWNFSGDIVDGNTVLSTGHEFNEESVFEVVFVDRSDNNFNWGYNGEGSTSPLSTVRNQEYGITWGNVIPSDKFLDEFEDGDPRYKFTVYEEGDPILTSAPSGGPLTLTADMMNIAASTRKGVTKKRFFRKYNIYEYLNATSHYGGINHRLIRYADVLLMLAECEAEVGTPGQAATYINLVRARPTVNMPPVTLASKEAALKAVMHERTVELGIESVNNIDILRWRARGYYPSIMADPKPGQVDMLPIPSAETSTNPMIN